MTIFLKKELEFYLRSSATLLRGLIDAGDYKQRTAKGGGIKLKSIRPFFCRITQTLLIPSIDRSCCSPPTLLTLAQDDVTPADNNNRSANHRAWAGHIRKD